MMPPADRIYDPNQGAKKDLTDTGDDFIAIGLALRIMQLNVEGLSAAKREVSNYNALHFFNLKKWCDLIKQIHENNLLVQRSKVTYVIATTLATLSTHSMVNDSTGHSHNCTRYEV